MAENTTNINDLPTDPTGGGSISGNVSLVASEATQNHPSSEISLDQSTISQIVNGLQQASATGVTGLPSRDIPRSTEGLTHDPQIQPNYVPSPPMNKRDFIHEDMEQDFDYKDDKFNSMVMLDKEGVQKHKFKPGSYIIAVKVIDNEGLEAIDTIKIKINGEVKQE